MKKNLDLCQAFRDNRQKILLRMKLTFFMLVAFVLQVSATVYSQSTKFNFEIRDEQVVDVLKQIESNSDFRFFFQREQVDVTRKVDLVVSNSTVEDILDKLFENQDITYKVLEDDLILLLPAKHLESGEQQQVTITGKVIDSQTREPMPGVNIVVKGTSIGAMSNIDGNYSLSVTDRNAVLVFSFIGYVSKEIPIAGKTTIDVDLMIEMKDLEEVVVIGYGTVKKRDLTGSIASIKSNDISAFPKTNLSQTLQGLASGVHVQQNSGQPGSGIQIRIRGTNSIQGSNEPLWIIDGFPGESIFLNPSDIESIEILKDASATAIYGSRGANGVIIVTTKQGKEGATRIDYSGSYSIQTVAKKLDMMNAKEYAQLFNIYTKAKQGTEYFSQDQINSFGKGTDWQDVIFRNAPVQDHSLNISGGNAKTKFSVGASLLDQAGIVQSSDYRRLVLRASINHDISKKFSVSYNAILNRIDQNAIDETSVMRWALEAPPTVGPYDDNGKYRLLNTVYPFSPDDLGNPVAYFNEKSNKSFSTNVMTNLAFILKPIKDLSIKISGNVSNIDSRSDSYTSVKMPQTNSSASIGTGNSLHLNLDNVITYNKTLNLNHNFVITGAITYENYNYKNFGASGTGFLSDVTETYNLGSASLFGVPYSSYSDWTLLSYLGRINYSFKSKYIVTASIRADGSSRYSKNNKWGSFPSGAIAWRFSEEDFMKDIPLISDGKIRVGYGETGSTSISPYYTLDMLSSGKVALDNQLYTFFAPGTRLPADLKWETTSQFDIGLDVGILNNSLRLTADYYIKNTRDLLNTVQLPLSLGYVTTLQNIGKIQNKGLELQLDAKILDNKIFKWDVTANISFNRNKIVSLYGGQDIKGSIYSVTVDNSYINLLHEGKPFGAFVGYMLEGFDATGHFVYKDLNNDGKQTDADRTWIGDPNPDFIYGLNSRMSWKNFSLNIFIQGSQGNDILGLTYLHQNYLYYQGFNTLREVLYNHWSAENPDAKFPVIDYSMSPKYSDQFVFDGSYLRLKNIELGYNIPFDKFGVNWVKGAFIYVSGQNLVTITSYPWWDPEVNSSGGSNSVNQGLDYYSYPTAKGFTFGIKLTF
ncbi:MAG: SusC/RagA family TonB-linked outer membrane protein [Bacteroidales bacterium]|nr:SusC/RagA family TonB-linked outer membrane protein [Bacteroidales bacterium]